MLCSVYTTIAGEYDGPGFCTPIGINSGPVVPDFPSVFQNVLHLGMKISSLSLTKKSGFPGFHGTLHIS